MSELASSSLTPTNQPHIVLACERRVAPPCWLVEQAALRRWTGTGGIGLRLGGEGQVLGLRNLCHLDLKLATYSAYAPKVIVAGRGWEPSIDGKTSRTWKERQAGHGFASLT